jgi:Spy/CpxP family protein refolding chaperone
VRTWIVLVAALLVTPVSLPAAAQHAQGGGRQAGPGRPSGPQQAPARDMRQQQRDANRDARMTPEQRRQLRRDVVDHGRDIYGGGRPNPNQR